MPSSKRAKLSHSKASSGEESLPAGCGDLDPHDAEHANLHEEQEAAEEEEAVEEYAEEVEEEAQRYEHDVSGDLEEVPNVAEEGDTAEEEEDARGIDAVDDEEEEEIEEVEEVVEEEEVEEEDGGEIEGEADSEDDGHASEGSEETGGSEAAAVSEAEYMEEDVGSIESDVGSLRHMEGDVDEGDQDTHNTAGDVDDADEENEGISTKGKNHIVDNDNDDEDGDEDDDNDDLTRKQPVLEVDDEEDERRKQLAVLMCFSSFQTLMAMELCRDLRPPLDEVSMEDTTMLPATFLKLVVLAATSLMKGEGQQSWKFQRPGQEWAHIGRGVASVDATTRDSIWRQKYSMSYSCFLYLVEELRPFIQLESLIYVRVPLETERAVAMVLYRFAHGLSAPEVAEKYNVEASTVRKYTRIVASALSEANKLYGRYLAIPTGERIARIISQFQQITNVSQMCGAIDGTYIKLHSKADKCYGASSYQSRPNSHSILLQAVCDANGLFWDVCCMASGGAHEAAQFISSNLYQKVKDGLSLQEPLLTLGNREVTPFMVGDSVYPLRPFLMKPFDTDDALRRAFDEQLRKGLACIDGAFAILKTRWRILKCMNVNLMLAPRVSVACCVLHNICQLWGEPEPLHEQIELHVNEHSQGLAAAYEVDEASRLAGEAAREALFRDWVRRSLDNPYVPYDQENMSTGQN